VAILPVALRRALLPWSNGFRIVYMYCRFSVRIFRSIEEFDGDDLNSRALILRARA
jgi:hypothetical protein